MSLSRISRRQFLGSASAFAAAGLSGSGLRWNDLNFGATGSHVPGVREQAAEDYTLRIAASAIEIAPKRIVSTITYNGKFPGPLLPFKEGQLVAVEIHNDTDT